MTFPVWSPWVVKNQLPINTHLHSFESGYPGLRDIAIPHIGFKVNDFTINVYNLNMDYQLNIISLEKIRIEKEQAEDAKIALLQIPELDILQLAIINKINNINISNLEYIEKDTRLEVSQLKLERLDHNIAQLLMQDIQLSGEAFISGQTISSLELTVKLIADSINESNADTNDETISKNTGESKGESKDEVIAKSQGSELYIEIAGDIQGHVSYRQPSYQKNEGTLQLKGSIDLKQAVILSDLKVQGFHTKPRGPITFNWTHNRENNVQQLLLQSQLIITDVQTDSRSLQFHPLEESSSSSLTLPVKVKVTSSSEQFPIRASLDISTHLDTGMQLLSSELESTIKYPELNINADLTLEDLNLILDNGLSINSSGNFLIPELIVDTPEGRVSGNFELDWQNITPAFSSGTFSMGFNSAEASFSEYLFDNLQLSSDYILSTTAITGKGELKMNQELITPLSLIVQKQSNKEKVVLDKNQLSNPLLNELLNIVGKSEKLQLSIYDGEIFHTGKLNFIDGVQFQSLLDVSDAGMQFGKNSISGLTIKQEVASINPLQLQTDLSIKKVQFASGLDLTNISSKVITASDISTAGSNFDIQSLKGEIFSGKLSSQTIKTQADGFAETIMRVDNISMMELFFFMDIPGLYAEGKISFKIPTSLKKGTLIVKDGTFHSVEKGIIKYSTELASSEGDENIALKALENFHYQTLDGTMSYNEDGYYKIKLHLLGANPELYDGYPVDFTLNLQGELPGVFRSLFVTGNFEQAVMDKVKSTDVEK